MKYVAWWSVVIVGVTLWASCSSDSTSNDEGDDDGAGGPSLGGASGAAGTSSGGMNQGGGGPDGAGGTTGGGEDGAGGARGGTAGDSGDGGAGDAGEPGTGGRGAGAGGSAGATTAGSGAAGRGGGAGSGGGGSGGGGGCVGLECQVVSDACPASSPTTLSGTVYAPNGTLPIYNARVYVPRIATFATPEDTVSCATCSSPLSATPVAVTASDATGHFVLSGVPSGSNVPFVIEMGKWRRIVSIPTVTPCVNNPITNADLTRLPKSHDEGNIPRIAITTGGAEALECLPRRLGIVDTEITSDAGGGRIHLYAGGDGKSFAAGGNFAAATALWSDRPKLRGYDMVLLSCEGSTSKFAAQKPQPSIDNLAAYADAGGRIFFSHLHYYWLQRMAGFAATASYVGGLDPPSAGVTAVVNQTFPKGSAFAQWLNSSAVGATTALGQIALTGSEHSVTAVTSPTVEWLGISPNPANGMHSTQVLSFNTPLADPEASQCGRSTFGDVHFKISVAGAGGDDSDPGKPFPTGCKTSDMSPQGKALAFLFFDLSACVQPDRLAPVVP